MAFVVLQNGIELCLLVLSKMNIQPHCLLYIHFLKIGTLFKNRLFRKKPCQIGFLRKSLAKKDKFIDV
jgi:hypothetical protein